MKKIRTLCLLGLANLECPAKAIDMEESDKKYRKSDIVKVKGHELSPMHDLRWFHKYEKAHRYFDKEIKNS